MSMGPEDQHPWDREDEEISQAFAAKDAEIERLKSEVAELADALTRARPHLAQPDLDLIKRVRERK